MASDVALWYLMKTVSLYAKIYQFLRSIFGKIFLFMFDVIRKICASVAVLHPELAISRFFFPPLGDSSIGYKLELPNGIFD